PSRDRSDAPTRARGRGGHRVARHVPQPTGGDPPAQRGDRGAGPAGRAAARAGRARPGPRPSAVLVTASRADLAFLGARQLAALVRERTVSPVEITQLYLERIDRLDRDLRAYITVLPDAA